MARKPRVHFPGAQYHCICRGNNREWVFNSDTDKRSYLSILSQYKERYGLKLYAWAILSNHVHMLIEVRDVPLSKIMQGIQQSYTGRYNHFNKRTGHVFEQRYKAFLCYDQAHLLSVIRYIHQNPLRAGLEGGLDHVYSSHKDYLSPCPGGLTDTDYPLRLFASERTEATRKYSEFIKQDDHSFNPYKAKRVEDEAFVVTRLNTVNFSLDELLAEAARLSGLSVAEITSGSCQRSVVAVRRTLAQFSAKHTRISHGELAEALRVADSTISMALRARSKDVDVNVSQLLQNLKR